MKKQSSLYILAAVVLHAAAYLPVSADEARQEQHDANREAAKADSARTDSAVQSMEGHHVRAKLAARHARHEEHRAIRHADNAALDRSAR